MLLELLYQFFMHLKKEPIVWHTYTNDLCCIITLCLFVAFSLTGLSRGGQQVAKCKEMFRKALQLLIELATLQVMITACMHNSSSLSSYLLASIIFYPSSCFPFSPSLNSFHLFPFFDRHLLLHWTMSSR